MNFYSQAKMGFKMLESGSMPRPFIWPADIYLPLCSLLLGREPVCSSRPLALWSASVTRNDCKTVTH